jgi:hypothetical protein
MAAPQHPAARIGISLRLGQATQAPIVSDALHSNRADAERMAIAKRLALARFFLNALAGSVARENRNHRPKWKSRRAEFG